jgi:voltage-dependent calcium channel alpha-2/delta-4
LNKFRLKNVVNCGRQSLDDDSYYCNKELVELLVFDAKVTNDSYQSWTFENEVEREMIERYNATVRFVSTMSGLTRWHFIFGEVEIDSDTEFGDLYSTSLNEPWYKSAVLQHNIDPQSFVYSVPFYDDERTDPDIKVTASMAIFPRDGGKEAPSAVVGFQFSHYPMYERFMEITSTVNVRKLIEFYKFLKEKKIIIFQCDDCINSCGSDEQDCFVIDTNGYIIISESNINDTGKFFGEIEGAVMEDMIDQGIFDHMVIYDYQGLCLNVTTYNDTLNGSSSIDSITVNVIKFLFYTRARLK